MKKQLIKVIILLGLFLPSLCIADAQADETSIQSLIDSYGVDNLIEVIIDKRFGEITIDKNGDFVSAFGKPNKSHITTKTIITDIENLGIDVAKFTQLVEKHVEKKIGKDSRLKKKAVTPTSKSNEPKSSSITVRYGEADKACMDACKKKFEPCQLKANEDSKKCKTSSNVEQCLSDNSTAAMKCGSKVNSCQDGCFKKVIKK
jgi:predicted DNA binding CopG/RHH family protein